MNRYTGGIAYDIEADKSGNIFVAGVSDLSNYTLLKYNNIGNQQWSLTTQAYSFAVGVTITLDSIGNIYLGGSKVRGAWRDLIMSKFNTNGTQLWTVLYPGIGNTFDEAYSIALDKSGHVYATGKHYSGGYDFLTVKYSQPIGIKPISNEVPKEFQLYQNYPNPFNPTTKIKFALPPSTRGSLAKLVVYDMLGREVQTIVNEQLTAGTYEADWNASNYPSGVYYYKLTAHQGGSSTGDFNETKKMVLVK